MVLFSSTAVPCPSPLFTSHTDKADPELSRIQTVADDSSSSGLVPKTQERGPLSHRVLHIQGPDPSKTYIQAGVSMTEHRRRLDKGKGRETDPLPLGVELGWIGMHIKRLGRRDLAIEVGILDGRGREGAIRISSFKVRSRSMLQTGRLIEQETPTIHFDRAIPLLHLPLNLPARSTSTMTPWLHISFDINTLIPLFERLPRRRPEVGLAGQGKRRKTTTGLPSGKLGSITYVRIYANCRVRRIWFVSSLIRQRCR